MSPIWLELLQTAVRYGLTIVLVRLEHAGLLTSDQVTRMLGPFSADVVAWLIVLAPLAWGLRATFISFVKRLAAREAPPTASIKDIAVIAKDPDLRALAFSKNP